MSDFYDASDEQVSGINSQQWIGYLAFPKPCYQWRPSKLSLLLPHTRQESVR